MAEELTLERVAHYPMPGMNVPVGVRFSPDGRLLTYLWSKDESLVRQLWAHDIETGESYELMRPPGQGDTDATVSAEEALRRERQRMRGFGITSYLWARDTPVLLVPVAGKLLVSKDGGESLFELQTNGEAVDPQLSPNGDAIAYVQDGEIWTIDTNASAQPRRLTFDASPPDENGQQAVTNGLAEFIAQEEMGRSSGFWWSDEWEQHPAFAQVDVSGISLFTIPHDSEQPPGKELHRYPFAGGPNARFKLGIVGRDGGTPPGGFRARMTRSTLARVNWAPDGRLFFQLESRDQRRLELRVYDPSTKRTDRS